ncbi:uncharacterized protein N7459_010024 [Penicillium hispanicum]|uniref:uncharacterized protein n=1 Tax=Penicillium hispanicum TaxID=1080232 RepID=UPI00253FDFF2|nr:uncharacterized protein N7459_010024 [Penicillium hispanicum]KAJ5570594.1 hypothetical protein N7459_010024 [Penicillium hispanicum]
MYGVSREPRTKRIRGRARIQDQVRRAVWITEPRTPILGIDDFLRPADVYEHCETASPGDLNTFHAPESLANAPSEATLGAQPQGAYRLTSKPASLPQFLDVIRPIGCSSRRWSTDHLPVR